MERWYKLHNGDVFTVSIDFVDPCDWRSHSGSGTVDKNRKHGADDYCINRRADFWDFGKSI